MIGVLANVGVLAEEVTGDNVVLPAENLFAVVAGIQPSIRIFRLPDQHGCLAQRFAQIHRIVNHSQHRNDIAVPDVMFARRSPHRFEERRSL